MRPIKFLKLFKILIILAISLFVLWMLFRPSFFTQKEQLVIISRRLPRTVWDFVADVNHLKITNPFLKNFEIIADGGIYPEWEYSAILKEDIPVLGTVDTYADIMVKPLDKNFVIITKYTTCKFLLCVLTNSTLTFASASHDEQDSTAVMEVLYVHTPKLLQWFTDISAITKIHLTRLHAIKHHLESSF